MCIYFIFRIKPVKTFFNSCVKPTSIAGVITSSTSICIYTEETRFPTEFKTMAIITTINCHL